MTKVIFRKFADGDIIALFPEEVFAGYLVSSYMHIGQHSEADYNAMIAVTKPASEKEYAALYKELQQVGYDDLKVIKRKPTKKH